MAPKKLAGLTAEQLRSLLHYDPKSGRFTWRKGIAHWRAGLPAGTESRGGTTKKPYIVIGIGTTSTGIQNRRYIAIGIEKHVYRAHRLAWLYVHGRWPKGEIDHINGNGRDNRIVNLREATTSQNGFNRGLRSDNTSGYKGISWNKKSSQWLAHIGYRGKIVHLGLFDTIEEAKTVRDEAARRLHGTFARIE
jgi:hypothetical protein